MYAHLVIRAKDGRVWLVVSSDNRKQPYVICAEQLKGDMVRPHEFSPVSTCGKDELRQDQIAPLMWSKVEPYLPLHYNPTKDRHGMPLEGRTRYTFTAPISHYLTEFLWLKPRVIR